MAVLKMDFGAADFKSDPKSKELIFLELNSSPIFVKFDPVLDGALCESNSPFSSSIMANFVTIFS